MIGRQNQRTPPQPLGHPPTDPQPADQRHQHPGQAQQHPPHHRHPPRRIHQSVMIARPRPPRRHDGPAGGLSPRPGETGPRYDASTPPTACAHIIIERLAGQLLDGTAAHPEQAGARHIAERPPHSVVTVALDGIEPCQVVVTTRAADTNPLGTEFVRPELLAATAPDDAVRRPGPTDKQ